MVSKGPAHSRILRSIVCLCGVGRELAATTATTRAPLGGGVGPGEVKNEAHCTLRCVSLLSVWF